MSKNYIHVNAGRVKLTKYDRFTGALSTNPKDIRICTETCTGISRKKSVETYEVPDGNSDYPAAIVEKAVKYDIGVELSSLSTETIAFLNNTETRVVTDIVEEISEVDIPTTAPYEIEAIGNISGTPTVLDANNQPFEKIETGDLVANQFKVVEGVTGTRQSMSKTVTTAATTAGTATVTITAAGSHALKAGKAITVNLTASNVNTNASEIRSTLLADPDITTYFDVGGSDGHITLTRKDAAEAESEAFTFALGTAVGAVLGATSSVAGVADVPAKFVFSAANGGQPVTLDYYFNASGVVEYDIPKVAVSPVMQIEIVHETLSVDKNNRYKNNSIISRAQLVGEINEDLAREHKPTTLNFSAIKPKGSNVVRNKKVEIKL